MPFESSKDTRISGASRLSKTMKTDRCAIVLGHRGGCFESWIGKQKRVKGESLHDILPVYQTAVGLRASFFWT